MFSLLIHPISPLVYVLFVALFVHWVRDNRGHNYNPLLSFHEQWFTLVGDQQLKISVVNGCFRALTRLWSSWSIQRLNEEDEESTPPAGAAIYPCFPRRRMSYFVLFVCSLENNKRNFTYSHAVNIRWPVAKVYIANYDLVCGRIDCFVVVVNLFRSVLWGKVYVVGTVRTCNQKP